MFVSNQLSSIEGFSFMAGLSLEGGSRRFSAGCETTLRQLLRTEDKFQFIRERKIKLHIWKHKKKQKFTDHRPVCGTEFWEFYLCSSVTVRFSKKQTLQCNSVRRFVVTLW